jgi:hypothetical protein
MMSILILMASTVGVPLLAMILLAILEAIGVPATPWQQLKRVGHDLCILSFGIAASMFGNSNLRGHLDPEAAAVISIVVVIFNMILAGIIILVDSRVQNWADRTKGSLSAFLGVITVAIPSGVILYVTRQP